MKSRAATSEQVMTTFLFPVWQTLTWWKLNAHRLGQDEQTAADLVTKVRARNFKNDLIRLPSLWHSSKAAAVINMVIERTRNSGRWRQMDYKKQNEGGDDIEFGGLFDEYAMNSCARHIAVTTWYCFNIKGTNMNVYNGKSWFCKDAVTDRNGDISRYLKVRWTVT